MGNLRVRYLALVTLAECVVAACTSVSEQADGGSDADATSPFEASFGDVATDTRDSSVCDAGLTLCGTACVDLLTNAANCGACGTVCQAAPPSTAMCTGGRCLVTLATGQGGASALIVDSSNVYFTTAITGGGVMSVPIGGGNVSTLTSNQNAPFALAIANGVAYWTNFGSGEIMSMLLDGGTPTPLATGQPNPVGIAADSTHAYWTNYKGAAVMAVGFDGGPAIQLAYDPTAAFDPNDIAVDTNYAYWTVDQGSPPYVAVMRSPLDGGTVDASYPVTPGVNTAQTLASDGTYVYFNANGPIKRAPIGGGASTTVVPLTGYTGGFAIDTANVYVLANGLIRAPLDGGITTSLYDAAVDNAGANPQRPHTVSVDATSVYWTDFASGTVMKLTPK